MAGATIKGRGVAVLTDVFFTQEGSNLIVHYTISFQFVLLSSSIWSSEYNREMVEQNIY